MCVVCVCVRGLTGKFFRVTFSPPKSLFKLNFACYFFVPACISTENIISCHTTHQPSSFQSLRPCVVGVCVCVFVFVCVCMCACICVLCLYCVSVHIFVCARVVYVRVCVCDVGYVFKILT